MNCMAAIPKRLNFFTCIAANKDKKNKNDGSTPTPTPTNMFAKEKNYVWLNVQSKI